MRGKVVVVFDTETTGFVGPGMLPLEKQPHIIEFSAIKYARMELDEPWQKIDAYDALIKPPKPITDEIRNITGITNEMLSDCKPFVIHAPLILDFMNSCDTLVGQNITFDEDMLKAEFARLNITDWPSGKLRRYCTVELNEPVFGRRVNLTELVEHYLKRPHAGAHRAMVDVVATWEVFNAMMEKGLV